MPTKLIDALLTHLRTHNETHWRRYGVIDRLDAAGEYAPELAHRFPMLFVQSAATRTLASDTAGSRLLETEPRVIVVVRAATGSRGELANTLDGCIEQVRERLTTPFAPPLPGLMALTVREIGAPSPSLFPDEGWPVLAAALTLTATLLESPASAA